MAFNLLHLIKQLKPAWLSISPICLLCLARVERGQLAICEACFNDLPRITTACDGCGLPIPHSGLCGQCLASPPPIARIIVPYRYEFPIAQLISRFKYHSQLPLGYLLAELLSNTLQQHFQTGLTKPDYLLAVPLSSHRLKERGFNQAALIAQWISKKMAVPVSGDTLVRVKDTPPQQSLSAQQRHTNLKNAFQVSNSEIIRDRHIAIVDDVVTTASTVTTLAQLLLKAGAKRVDIYAIARTPHRLK